MSGKLNTTKPSFSVIDLNNPADTFKFVVIISAVVFTVAVIFFSLMRSRFKQIYAPRLLLIENKSFAIGPSSQFCFSWITLAFSVTDEDIYTFAGIDALVYIRFLRLVLKLALLTLPYGMIVLIPINFYGKNKLTDGLDMLSMSNVLTGSSHIWAHWFAVYLYSIIVFCLTYCEWHVYIKFRQRFLMKGSKNQFAVFVRNLPADYTDDESFKDFVDILFPNKVSSICVVKDLGDWEKLIKRHDKFISKWENAKYVLETKNKRPTFRSYPCGEKRDSIVECETVLETIQEKILQEQNSPHKIVNCAFVIFKSLKAQTIALQTVWINNPLQCNIRPAPDPSEIVWSNLRHREATRIVKVAIGYAAVFLLVLFWAVPISFISTLTHLQSVANEFKWLDDVFVSGASRWVLSFVQGVVPIALLATFFLLLSFILFAIAKYQGYICKSDMAMMVFKCLFIFQTVNTFFVYIISGSILQYLENVVERPFALPSLLAKSVPSQAGFFINYFAIMSMVGLAMELTRIGPLILTTIQLKWLAKTPREKIEAWRPKRAEYEVMYSQALLFFLIGITYSILSPIIIPFFVIYFAFGYIVWIYQLLHVYIPDYEHGGKFWPEVFYRMILCVLLFQLLMVGVFLLKQVWWAAVLTAPLVIFTALFWWFMADKYQRSSNYLCLDAAKDTKYAEKKFLEGIRKKYILNSYVPDVFEMSNEKFHDSDDYYPVNGSIIDTDEDGQELSENQRLLSR